MNYEFHWPVLWQYRELLWEGFQITMLLFAAGTVASLLLGVAFGICGASHSRTMRVVGEVYVEVNRNTPLVVKLFFLYFAFGMEAYPAAILGLALHQSAYMAEIVRAGIQSISTGQMEAGLSSGLTRLQTLRRVVLPQGLIIVIPPLTTQVLETLKNSSIAMTIAIPELTFQTQQIEAYSFRGFEAATAATVIYLIVGLLVAASAVTLEWWLTHRRMRIATLKVSVVAEA